MLLEQTLSQLDVGTVPQDRAEEMGHLGFMQWLGALPGQASYPDEAMHAYDMARPFRRHSPAVAVFCDLLIASTISPCTPLSLRLPRRHRRGGALARRLSL
ncbi:MAG: hypothetical protein AAGB05_17030 [Pseudomonadota bacterium]